MVVLAVPNVRAKVVPPIRHALSSLWSVARIRRKRSSCSAATSCSELLYALALGATCLAYGVHLNLAQLIFVNISASVLSSLIPVPGGIGAAEASPSAGLDRDGRRRVDRIRDRPYPTPLHLLPSADLGLPLDAVAAAEGIHLRSAGLV